MTAMPERERIQSRIAQIDMALRFKLGTREDEPFDATKLHKERLFLIRKLALTPARAGILGA